MTFNCFSIGTVQFGTHYGITNSAGAPSQEVINCMLDAFVTSGNSFLDSAKEYGNAHQVIAQWLNTQRLIQKDELKITTKVFVNDAADIEALPLTVAKICDEFGIATLYGLMIHNPSILIEKKLGAELNQQFNVVKESNLVKKTGVSVYAPQEVFSLKSQIQHIDIIQCPVNIFDQRFITDEFSGFCLENKIEIHARSLFLQGLLLATVMPSQIKNDKIKAAFKVYQDFNRLHNLTNLEACLLFAYNYREKIDRWVVGFNKYDEILEFFRTQQQISSHPRVCFDTLVNKDHYIDPRKWEYIQLC